MKKSYKKYFLIPLAIIFLIVIIVFIYFYTIWVKEDNIRERMITKAQQRVPALSKIDDIDFFAGDQQYYFILGKNKKGIPILVWENEKEIHSIYLFQWVTKDEIRKKALEYAPNSVIKRINIGINEKNELIYEVLYEDEDQRLGYQYYYLKTGEQISVYRLGKTYR